jgi:hypothetical protein
MVSLAWQSQLGWRVRHDTTGTIKPQTGEKASETPRTENWYLGEELRTNIRELSEMGAENNQLGAESWELRAESWELRAES